MLIIVTVGRLFVRVTADSHYTQALGLVNCETYPETRWFSPSGVSMEPNGDLNGGFTAGYGDIAWMTDWISALTNRTDFDTQAANIVKQLTKFRLLENCYFANTNSTSGLSHNRCLRIESVISSRHDTYPRRISYGPGRGHGALVRKDPVAIRLAQMRIQHGDVFTFTLNGEVNARNPHFPGLRIFACG